MSSTRTRFSASWAWIASVQLLVGAWLIAAETPPLWSVVRAGNVDVYTDARPGVAVELANELLRSRAVLAKIGGFDAPPKTIRVLAFRSQREFESVTGKTDPRRAAFFVTLDDVRYFAVDTTAINAGHAAAQELVRTTIAASRPGAPLWLREGMALLCADVEVAGSQVIVGGRARYRFRELRNARLIPLRELLADRAQPHFEAEALALVHYLTLKGRAAQLPYEELDAMERELANYVRAPVVGALRFHRDELPIDTPSEPSAVNVDAPFACIGEMLLGAHQSPSIYFDAALAINPSNAIALAGRARMLDGPESIALYRRALAIAPDEPSLAYARQAVAREDFIAAAKEQSIDRQQQYETLIARYDAAVAHVRDGEYAEARAALDTIIPQLDVLGGTELRDIAVALRSQLR